MSNGVEADRVVEVLGLTEGDDVAFMFKEVPVVPGPKGAEWLTVSGVFRGIVGNRLIVDTSIGREAISMDSAMRIIAVSALGRGVS